MILLLMLFTILVIQRINRSRMGMILTSISQAENVAESIGINVKRYKVLAFVTGSFFAGIGGSFFAHYFTHISPELFIFWVSVNFLVFVVVGGQGSIWGPIIGACTLSFFSESFRTFGDYEPMVFGIALIAVVMFLRQGIVSLPERVLTLIRKTAERAEGEPAGTGIGAR